MSREIIFGFVCSGFLTGGFPPLGSEQLPQNLPNHRETINHRRKKTQNCHASGFESAGASFFLFFVCLCFEGAGAWG